MPEPENLPEVPKFADLSQAFEGLEPVQRITRVHLENIQRHGQRVPNSKSLLCSPEANCTIAGHTRRLQLLWQTGDAATVHIVEAGQLSTVAAIATITSSDWAALGGVNADANPVDPQQILQVVEAVDRATNDLAFEARHQKAARKQDRKERRRRWWRRNSENVGFAAIIAGIVLGLGVVFTVLGLVGATADSYTTDALRSAQVYAPNDRPFQPTHSDQYDNQTVKGLDSESALLVPSSHPTAITVLGDSCTNVARTIRAGDRFRVVYSGSGNATVTIDAQHDNITVCPVKGAQIDRDDRVIIQGVHGK